MTTDLTIPYTKQTGELIKSLLAEGKTLRESSEASAVPFDLVLRWIDPTHPDFQEECKQLVEDGRHLGKYSSREVKTKVEQIKNRSLYTPVLLPLIEELVTSEMVQGRSLNSVAAKLGIGRDTLNKWRADYPEVDEVCKIGETAAIAYLEDTANKYLVEEPFAAKLNTQLFKHLAAVADPERHNVSSKSESTLKGDKNNPLILERVNIVLIDSHKPAQLGYEVSGEIVHEEQKTPEKT